MTPLFAYLLGFMTVQMAISASAVGVVKAMLQRHQPQVPAPLRSAGLVLCGIGGAFLYSQLFSVILP